MRMTFTVMILDPMANVTCPVYAPLSSSVLDAMMLTCRAHPPFKLPFAGLMLSQFAPSSVTIEVAQCPVTPQLTSVTC